MILLVVRAYRKEVFWSLKRHIRPELYKEAASGRVTLCYHEIRRLFTPKGLANISLVNCDRIKTRYLDELLAFLWSLEPDSTMRRGQWENIAYRVLCWRACELVQNCCGV